MPIKPKRVKHIKRRTFERLAIGFAIAVPVLAALIAFVPNGAQTGRAVVDDAAASTVQAANADASASAAAASLAEPASAATPTTATTLAANDTASTPAAAVPPTGLKYTTSWIGNTWGFGDKQWMTGDIQAIAVTPSGDIYTNAPWDEAGGEIGHFRDGKLLQYGNETHGWGRVGGDAIAVNDDYVYAAQTVSSIGENEAWKYNLPKKGEVWYGISRRARNDLQKPMHFDGEWTWPFAVAYKRLWTGTDKTEWSIRGLAADNKHLYVSNQRDNRIDILDAKTMQTAGNFPAQQPGKLALASDGTLWIIENVRQEAGRRVVHVGADGKPLAQLALPPGVVPVDVALDGKGRVYVADNGPRQQILIYDATATVVPAAAAANAGSTSQAALPTIAMTSTFGEEGGVYAGRTGAIGPQRFNGLTGVGIDGAGNIYVSMTGAGQRGYRPDAVGNTAGVLLESYAPNGTRRFSLQSLLFIDGMQYVEGDPPSAYSGGKRFTLDLSKPAGQQWTYAGYTADRFRYPYDPFFNLNEAQRGTPWIRTIDGHKLLYTLDMTSSYLRIYRFPEGNSETMIPSGLFALWHIDGAWPPNQPPRGEWIWRDTGGKGRFAPGDFTRRNNGFPERGPQTRGWWVDQRGNVWQATQEDGLRMLPLQGFDRLGNPKYDYTSMQTMPTPSPFNHLDRIMYDDAHDVMYLSGWTPAHPYNESNWNSMGSMMARYDHWKTRPTLRWTAPLPNRGPEKHTAMTGFTVEGDYVFTVEVLTGVVSVFDNRGGHLLGVIAPGPEVGRTSGMIDEAYPVTAHRLPSGDYLIFVEDDWHGKMVMYRFTPPASAKASADAATPVDVPAASQNNAIAQIAKLDALPRGLPHGTRADNRPSLAETH